MPIARGSFADLVNPAIRGIYFDEYGEKPEEYSKVFTMETSERDREIESEVTGFGPAPAKVEGDDIYIDTVYQGYDYTYTHATYGLGFIVTFEMMQDDLHNTIKKLPKGLARAMRETYETAAANIFNRAFNASYTYGDGSVLCVGTHTNPADASTDESNVLATPADLATTSLKAALTQLEKQTGDRGEYLMLKADVLLIPPDLRYDAVQILKSSGLAGTANNDLNSIKDQHPGLKFMVMTRLTDTDAWFLLADQREQAKYFWRHKPDLKDDMVQANRDVQYDSIMRFSVGASGWRWLIGTPGV